MLKEAVLLFGPILATIYATISAVFLPSFRECPWITHLPAVVPRLTLLADAVAACLPSWSSSQQHDNSNNNSMPDWSWWIMTTVSTFLSAAALVHTRIHVVQGGVAPALGDMTDRNVVITGANQGIGKETARLLLQQGATVIMACRSVGKAEAAKADIVLGQDSSAAARVHVVPLDLSSFHSVRQAAQQVKQSFGKVHVLINNAGLMMSHQAMTEDGYDMVMQANHLGHYLWTRLLLDHMDKQGRILCLTSSTYSYAERIDLDDLFCTKGRRVYSLFGQYAQSKLANIMFVQELARRTPYFCAAVHPGLVRTDVVRNMAWYLRYPNQLFAAAVAALQKTPTQGAWCSAYLASVAWPPHCLDDKTTLSATNGNSSKQPLVPLPNGQYWVNQKVQEVWPCAKDEQGARQLWVESERYVQWNDTK